MRKYSLGIFMAFLVWCLSPACKKDEYVGKDPYAGALAPLDIKVNKTEAVPSSGTPGTTVTISGQGFDKYKDSGLVVKFNDVEGEITTVSDNVLKVKVPKLASSGLITITVLHQVFSGPFFQVRGSLAIDTSFQSVPGVSGGGINCIEYVPGGKFLIGGNFTDYGNSGTKDGYHGVARINTDGSLDNSFKIGTGVQGTVASVVVQADGKYVIGGAFNEYNGYFGNNIMRLNPDGSMDSTIFETSTGAQVTLPGFNAYFDAGVSKILQTPDSGKLVVFGGFNYYMTLGHTTTEDELRDSIFMDSVRVQGVAMLKEDGSFDSSFNFDHAAHRSFPGTNGPINDAFVQSDGKIVIAGGFTKYNDQPANRIARLNEDGTLDPTFNVGAGPDNRVYSISPMAGGKLLIAGQFNNVDGKENHKVAVLNANGSVDNSFSTGVGTTAGPDGIVLKAAVLKNNLIFISGVFERYSGVKRMGTAVLNTNGSLSEDYNNLGALEPSGGLITQILNVPDANKTILVGPFTKYDLRAVDGIVMLKY